MTNDNGDGAPTPPGDPVTQASPAVSPGDDQPWWRRNPAALAAAIVAALAVVALLVVFLLSQSDDDDQVATDDSTTTTVEVTTTVDTTTTVPESTTTTETTTTTTTTVPETTTTTTTTPVPEPTTTVAPVDTTTLPVVTVPPAPEATMWDVITNSPDLSEFRAAIENADLVDLLDGPEPVTVFAPSNPAFELLQAGVGGPELLDDPDLMRRHLVSGLFTSGDVLAATTLETLAGDTLTVDATLVTVDGGRLIVIDIEVGGSILHVVDKVLVPPPTA